MPNNKWRILSNEEYQAARPNEEEMRKEAAEHTEATPDPEEEYLGYLSQQTEAIEKARAVRQAIAENQRKRFLTIRELFSEHNKPVEWYVQGIVPNESLISIQGRPKCGKSTFVFAMLKAILEGGEFLGKPTKSVKVVYLSEQNRVSMCQQLKEAGIDSNTDKMSVMTVEDAYRDGWDRNFQAAQEQLQTSAAKLLIVDSWGRFAAFDAHEEEYQTGPTLLRVNRLRELISVTHASVLIIHHTAKAQGKSLVDSGLGATALAAQVDQVFSLSGEPAQQAEPSRNMPNERCRCLQSAGRFTDAIRDIQIERLEDGTFRARTENVTRSCGVADPPPVEKMLQRLFEQFPELRTYGNQKLSEELARKGVKLSEKKIANCRKVHPELARVDA